MFQLSDILKAVGPAASIVFAAWIFMGFLQQRYDSASDRFRQAVDEVRSGELSPERRANLKDQILVYRRRCELMSRANLTGLASAVLLIGALIAGALDVMVPHVAALQVIGAACALVGLALVILAAGFVFEEGRITRQQLDNDLLDVPDLAGLIGDTPGSAEERRHGGRTGA